MVFSENFVSLFETFGIKLDWVTLDILLPVGISFYTFQALSYTIDIYQHKMKPTYDMVAFFAFISFFLCCDYISFSVFQSSWDL